MLQPYRTAFGGFLNRLQLPLRKTQAVNLHNWGSAFLARQTLPIRRLARTLAPLPREAKHADKRLRRFLGNERLPLDGVLKAYLQFLLPRFESQPFLPVMLDWTFVGNRAILAAAIPYKGRSLPLFATVHERSIERRVYSQTQAEIALLRRLRWCWPKDAPPPLLLADRGFDKSRLLEWLLHGTTGKSRDERRPSAPGSHPWLFVIRSCMKASVTDKNGKRLEKRLQVFPGESLLYEDVTYHLSGQFQLHLFVAGERDANGQPITWFLITNLPAPYRRKAARLYASRMSPEETYRDYKSGFLLAGFGLHGLKQLRRDRLERLLCLLTLVYGFLVFLAESEREVREQFLARHFRLSLISFALDALRTVPELIPKISKHALATVRLQPVWLESGDP